VDLSARPEFAVPEDYQPPEFGLHYRWPDLPGPQVEARMVEKLDAVRAFARANPIDRRIYDIPDARFGIITTGKGHLDLMEALRLLGVDEARAREIGIDIYKVGMVWPLETEGARAFLRGKEEVLVVEEKRGLMEGQIKEILYNVEDTPEVIGKRDELGKELFQSIAALDPNTVSIAIGQRILAHEKDAQLAERVAEREALAKREPEQPAMERTGRLIEAHDFPTSFFRPSALQVAGALGLVIAGFAASTAVSHLGGRGER